MDLPAADGIADDGDETGIPTAALAMRLRREMRAYKLSTGEDEPATDIAAPLTFAPETLEDAKRFLLLPVRGSFARD